jgi:hypothetical protein
MFIEPGHSMIKLLWPVKAVLSQNVRQHLEDFRPVDGSALDPTDHRPDVFHGRLGPRQAHGLGLGVACLVQLAGCFGSASGRAALVQVSPFSPPFLGLVICYTAPARLLPSVSLSTAKGTA